MSLGVRLRTIVRDTVTPPLVRRGWRGPHGTPVNTLRNGKLFGYDEEEWIRQAVSRVALHTMTTFERLATLWQQVRYLDRHAIAGALVECGVWKGGSSGMMALAHMASCAKPSRELHLFDSFEGLPEPRSDKDGFAAVQYSSNRAEGALRSIRQCVGTLGENRHLLEKDLNYPVHLLSYHVGWFENTVPEAASRLSEIALLRLDGDWYQSTRVCLESLYPRVVEGGLVVIDDYGHWEGCRTAVDEFLQSLQEPVLLNHIDYAGRYWIRLKGKS